jgi:hypothetical protein
MTSLLNFIKIYQLVQKLLGGKHRQTDRQTGDLISLTLLFKESRLKSAASSGIGYCYSTSRLIKRRSRLTQRSSCNIKLRFIFSIIFSLLNDAFNSPDYIVSNGRNNE